MPSAVLVHGLWMTGTELLPLKRRLRKAGFEVFIYRYPSVRKTLAENVERFAQFLEKIPGEKVHFVGHSLGGVLIERFLSSHAFKRPGRVVALGSPLNGCFAAERMKRFAPLRWWLGKSIAEMMAGARNPWRMERDFGVIAGTFPFGGGQLLGRLPSPNDGVILVEETKIEGIAAHLTLRTNHFGLLLSKKVSEQVVWFLREGCFNRK